MLRWDLLRQKTFICWVVCPIVLFVLTVYSTVNLAEFVLPDTPITAPRFIYTLQQHSARGDGTPSTAVHDEDVLYQKIISIHDSHFTKPLNETCEKRVPGAYIVGVPKSGTRELTDFLAMHPQIRIYRNGRKNYQFSSKTIENIGKIQRSMPCLYSNQIGLVKSDSFFRTPHMPKVLKDMNSNLKVIAIVREPIARLLSHLTYNYYRRHRPKENRFNVFHDVVKNIPELDGRIIDENGKLCDTNMLRASTYDNCLKWYLDMFPRKQILIIEGEEFKYNPAAVLKRVASFLELEMFPAERYLVYNEEKRLYCIQSRGVTNEMVCYGNNRGQTRPKELKPDTRRKLEEYFTSHNEKFFELLGKRFNWSYT